MPIPFPVDREYRIRARITPLSRAERPDGEPERGLLDPGDDWERYVDAKLAALAGETPCRQVIGAATDYGPQLRALVLMISEESAPRLSLTDRGFSLPHLGVELGVDWEHGTSELVSASHERVGDHLSAQTSFFRLLDAIALSMEEDFVLIKGPTGESPDRAQLLHVCLPSGWSARDKAGQAFGTIHGPVPHNKPLTEAHKGLVTAMINRGPFVRYVWGLHRDAQLCHDPYVHLQPPEPVAPTGQAAADASWFRVERQTTLGLPELNSAFFFIRVYQCPLREAITSPNRALRMATALRDMTPELADYKGVTERRRPLIEWLNRYALI